MQVRSFNLPESQNSDNINFIHRLGPRIPGVAVAEGHHIVEVADRHSPVACDWLCHRGPLGRNHHLSVLRVLFCAGFPKVSGKEVFEL